MAQVAEEAYTPYVARMNAQRPAPMDENYRAVVDETEAWVAEADGVVIGFLVLVGTSDGMLLEGVAVRPSHQGVGAGRALLTLAEDQARTQGYPCLRLYTSAAMIEHQRLYERIGYAETHRAEADGFARVFYEKALPG